MGSHPNAMLMAIFTPDGLARKTYRDIIAEFGLDASSDFVNLKIGGDPNNKYDCSYNIVIMEDSFLDEISIETQEGDIVVYDYITYGYCEKIKWEDLTRQQSELSEWACGICDRHNCTVEFYVSANFW